MKYRLKEHPVCVLFSLSIVLLAACIVIACLLEWSIAAIILVGIAVLAVGFLTYAFVFDLRDFNKKKKESEKNGTTEFHEEKEVEDTSDLHDDERID